MVGLVGHGAGDAAFAAALAVGSFTAFRGHGLFLIIILPGSIICLLPAVMEKETRMDQSGLETPGQLKETFGSLHQSWRKVVLAKRGCYGQAAILVSAGQWEPLQVWEGRAVAG